MSILKLKNKDGQWEEVDSLIGKEGSAGPSNSLSIGTVEKGENASATITGESPNQTLNLVLPKGDIGPQGEVGPKPVKGKDYFTSDDIEELNISRIEKYILLVDMSSSAPTEISLNSKYYNSKDKLIYTATDEATWSDFSEEPKKNVFYINVKNGAIYYWNGLDMVLIQPLNSVFSGTYTEEVNEENAENNECLIDMNNIIINPKIPRYENQSYEIGTSEDGTWIWKKYKNGLVELYHKIESRFNITQNYNGSNGYGTMWVQTPIYNYPITLTELISSQTTVVCNGHLTNFNYCISELGSYQGYLYDAMSLPNQTVKLYTTIVGKWK